MTQNKSPMCISDGAEISGFKVICEGFIEIQLKLKRKRIFCCFIPLRQPREQIVEAQLIQKKEDQANFAQLKFYSLKRGVKKPLDCQLDFDEKQNGDVDLQRFELTIPKHKDG